MGVIVALLACLVPASRASAATNGVMVGVFPEFPTRIDVGATNVPASINLINGSINAEASGSLTVTEVTLVASCGNFTPTCAGGADPGVFQLSSTGTGAAGTKCAGKTFDITVVDTATGRVRFAPSDGSALVLGGTDITNDFDTCRIRFTISALKVPATDSYPNLGEPQTNQVGFMTVSHPNGSTGADQGEDVTTLVGSAAPTVDPRYARWVDSAYRDLLGRPPTASESASLVSKLSTGQWWSLAWAAKEITNSAEFRHSMIRRYYTTHLGRPATEAEFTALVRLCQQSPLETCEAYVLASDEFYALHGSTLVGFAEALYRLVFGATPDPGGVQHIVTLVLSGISRHAVAVWFTDHAAAHDRVAASGATWLLDRPAATHEVDQWSAAIDNGVPQEDFFAYLVSSNEYWSKS